MNIHLQEHWDAVYTSSSEEVHSWYQPYPKTSMQFVQLFSLRRDANIIDVGGGDSQLVDALVNQGYTNIWVVDISAKAIERAKKRLGHKAAMVHWVVGDILEFDPPVVFDFWHDRAAFHFLTTEANIEHYVYMAETFTAPGGCLVLGTFSEEGPRSCSGLEVRQYSETSMSYRFEDGFNRVKCVAEDHITPFNTHQQFLFCSFLRKAA